MLRWYSSPFAYSHVNSQVSDPNYRRNVEATRQSAAEFAREKAALRSQPTKFPEPHDPAGILRFALSKINHAEQCVAVAIDDRDDICCRGEEANMPECASCRGEAAVCIAEALYVLSYQEAKVMLEHAKRILPPESYCLVHDKYAELKKNDHK
ncbi:hypothetical protein ACI65C_012247 [Semiaphis heraclei]